MVGKICLKEQDKMILNSKAIIHREPAGNRFQLEVEAEPNTCFKMEQTPNRLILMRKNETLRMRYTFQLEKTTKGICQVAELNRPLWLTIYTKKLTQEPGYIYVEYLLEDTPYQFEIKWREL